MKSANKNNVLKKKDGTLICAYCLNPVTIESEMEYDGYSPHQYDVYECTCDEWNNDIRYNKLKDELEEEYEDKLKDDIRRITMNNELELKAKLAVLKKKYGIVGK